MSRNRFLFLTLIALTLVFSSQFSATATEPNDSFAEATILAAGTLSVADSIEGLPGPDTLLGFFADDTYTPPTVETNDDDSPLGNGYADALFDISVNADGSIPLAISGIGDDDFDGSHSEEGDYDLFVDVYDAAGDLIDSFSDFGSLTPGVVDEFSYADPTWIGGTFDAVLDNTVGADPTLLDLLDFWVFTGLTPGTSYVAEIVDGDFDTILALLAPDGTLEETDDDDGEDLLSKLIVTASASGELYLAVTGFSDFDLDGIHGEFGSYELTVSTVVPEPTALVSFLVGLAMFLGYHRKGSN